LIEIEEEEEKWTKRIKFFENLKVW